MTETFDLSLEQARTYERHFVPALFSQWVDPMLTWAGVQEGSRVLDVGCGTGILARTAAGTVGPTGRVVGVDLNPAMLHVAEELEPAVDWRVGDAARLPFPDATFDVAACQSALFFFPDPAAALCEMARVVQPGGTVAVQTYCGLADQPGYGPFVDLVAAHVGDEARALLGTYWSQGDPDALRALLRGAGLDSVSDHTLVGHVAFGSVDELVSTEIDATPLAAQIDDTVRREITDKARVALASYVGRAGGIRLPIRALFTRGEAC